MAYQTEIVTVEQAAVELRRILESASRKLAMISSTDAALPVRDGGWTRAQILGHLIDSAANNHHRFIRAQVEDDFRMAPYDQEAWVATAQYARRDWHDLLALWTAYNYHLLHLMETTPLDAGNRLAVIGDGDPVTLRYLMIDYVVHLEHHLAQITGDWSPEQSRTPVLK